MEASTEERIFGDPDDAHTQVNLPAEVNSGENILRKVFIVSMLCMADRENSKTMELASCESTLRVRLR